MKTNKPRFIYYVFGESGAIRYVGCSVNPRGRLRQHIWDAHDVASRENAPLSPFAAWLLKEEIAGRSLNVCTVRPAAADWETDERNEIEFMIERGAPLLNTNILGFPHRWSAESRMERRSGKAYKRPDETAAGRGIPLDKIRVPKRYGMRLLKRPRAKAGK